MNASQFTPSELIYLFLDGEHSQVERTVLFNALVNNEDLQTEFEDALKIRAAATQEAQTLLPPSAVTQSLMSRAGFVAAGAVASAPAATWLSQWFSSWGATLLTYVVPALTALGGFALGYSTQTSPSVAEAATTPQGQTVSVQEIQAATNKLSAIEQENAHLLADIASLSAAQRQLSRENAVQQRRIVALEAGQEQARNTTASLSSSPSSLPQQPEASSSSSAYSPEVASTAMLKAEFAPQVMRIESTPMKVNLSVTETAELQDKDFGYAVSLRGLSSIFVPTESGVSNSNDYPVRNLSIGVQRFLSPNWSLAIEGGQEQFPLWVDGTDGLYLRQSMVWAAVGARYTMSPVNWLYNAQPTAQVAFGGSKTGPLMRASLGASYDISNRIALNAGVEAMSVLLHYQNTYELPWKYGISYGLTIKF